MAKHRTKADNVLKTLTWRSDHGDPVARRLLVEADAAMESGTLAQFLTREMEPAEMVSVKPTVRYVRVGSVERGPRYEWRDAYSENGNTYPWLTKREAQSDARRRGARAVFVEPRTGKHR